MDDQKSKQSAWIQQAEYLRLPRAAEQIGCTEDVLLHLGATGKVDILAPVLAEGLYEWPVSSTGGSYSGKDMQYRHFKFGIHHRVILARNDIARIEAVGWATPKAFFYPEAVRGWVEFWKDRDLAIYKKIRISAGSVPWYPVESAERSETQPQAKDDLRITAEHLFISIKEIERLGKNAPQDEAAEERKHLTGEPSKPLHGNISRFSKSREEVLTAAIACLFNEREIKITGPAWAKLVESKGKRFWRKLNPSLTHSEIIKLLNSAKRYPNEPQWDGREEK